MDQTFYFKFYRFSFNYNLIITTCQSLQYNFNFEFEIKMVKYFILCTLCCFSFLQAEETYWNSELVGPYVHNSELQRRWAFAFLAPHISELSGHEFILDIGCGDGKITADISNFVPKGKIVGIDPSPDI